MKTPRISERYVDESGRLTPAGYQLIEDMAKRIAALEARLLAAGIP